MLERLVYAYSLFLIVIPNILVENFRVIFTVQFAVILLGFCPNSFGSELKTSHHSGLNVGVYRPALNSYVDLKDIEISFNYWLQEVTRDLGLETTETHFYEKYQDLSSAFERRDVDMFIVPPLAVVMHFNKELIAEGFYSKNEKSRGDALLLLVRAENVGSITDMNGKKLILPKYDKLAEMFLEMTILGTYQKSYKQVFSKIEMGTKANRIILNLFFGASDVALIYKSSFDVMAEMNAQIRSRIKIIKSYPVLSKNMAFMHKDYPNRKYIIDHLKEFAKHPRGQQIMNIYHTEKIGISTVSMLDPFEQIYQQYLSLNLEKSLGN